MGESRPIFAQRKYTTAPTTNASTGAAGTATPRFGRIPCRGRSSLLTLLVAIDRLAVRH